MWSRPLLRRFRQSVEIQQTQVSQGFAAFRPALSRIPPRHSQTRRDTNFAIPGYSLSAMIPRRTVKIKFFLSVVIPVVKAAFVPFSATGGKPAIARAARLCGLLSKPRMDRVYAFPNQARYQLRYTRISDFPASAGKLFLILSCPAGKSNRRRTENLSAACTFMRPAPAGPAVPTAALRPPGTDPRRWTAGTCRPLAAPDSGR